MQGRASNWALENCKARLHLGALEMQSPPPVGRFRNAKLRLRLGALEMQGRASAWALRNSSLPYDFLVIAKRCQVPESYPGTLVTCLGVPKPKESYMVVTWLPLES